MRYILNFNPAATSELLGSGVDGLEVLNRNGNVVIRESAEGVAFSPKAPGSSSYKSRLSAATARAAGLRGSQRYVLKRGRGKTPSFTLVPHSQVRNSRQLGLDVPAVTVSITERAA